MDRKEIIKELDHVVSVIVRGRDDRCATCGRRLPFRFRQAGHFVPRVVQATRWDLENVNVQCNLCNVVLGGNISEYRKFIHQKYGKRTLERLDGIYRQYKNGKIKELPTEELERLLEELKSQI